MIPAGFLGLRFRSAVVLATALLGACASPAIREESTSALAARTKPFQVVAVMPFTVSEGVGDGSRQGAAVSPEEAVRVVSRQVTAALDARNVRTVSPEDVGSALYATGTVAKMPEVAQLLAEVFAADAVIVGRLTRWVERQGTAAAASRGASVAFEIALFDAPGGERLWLAVFNQTQLPLSENVLQVSQLPGGGSRWLTAEELARWGAERTARLIPLK